MPNATGSGEGWLADWFQAHRPQLRARRVRREDYVGTRLPEPVVAWEERGDPAQEVALADTVGLALLVT